MVADGYLRKLQHELTDTLNVFAQYCQEHDLTWFLISGSALGALRHGGFIPWDDDLDVGMLRPDYERFLECAARDYPEEYVVESPESNIHMAAMFAKVSRRGTRFVTQETIEAGYDQGIFLDVIPLDRLAPEGRERRSQLRNARFWMMVSYLYHAKSVNVPHSGLLGSVERIACSLAHVVLHAALSQKIILRNYARSTLVGSDWTNDEWCFLTSRFDLFFPSDILIPPSVARFENHVFPVPANPEQYLELMYGNWRELPPVEKRHVHAPLRIEFSDGDIWEDASRKG